VIDLHSRRKEAFCYAICGCRTINIYNTLEVEKMKKKICKRLLALTAAVTMLLGSSVCSYAAELKDVFDPEYYAEHNADVVAAFGTDEAALFTHFAVFGVNEGRQGMAAFNVSEYRNAYADLQAAFGDDWDAYVNHYMTTGVYEGRTAGVYGSIVTEAPSVDTTVPTPVETSQPVVSEKPSLEEVMVSPEMGAVVNYINESLAGMGASVICTAEGDTLVMMMKFDEVLSVDAQTKERMDQAFGSMTGVFDELRAELINEVSNENVRIRYVYINGDGTEIYRIEI